MTQSSITTILFTDLVGSTELQSQLGDDEMQAVRRAHFVMLGDQVAVHRGEVVKSLGDGIMAACASASDAVACAATAMGMAGVEREAQALRATA
jgi:class 3 adenylate cyclase